MNKNAAIAIITIAGYTVGYLIGKENGLRFASKNVNKNMATLLNVLPTDTSNTVYKYLEEIRKRVE